MQPCRFKNLSNHFSKLFGFHRNLYVLWFRIEGHATPAMTSAKKKQQNHENVPFSQGKTMWKAQQAKEKSGAARKREDLTPQF